MKNQRELVGIIDELKLKKDAIILAHTYQRKEVQEVADYVGDSLELVKKSLDTSAKLIVFCGVRFMAETVKILSPEKSVLIPRKEAGCPMADTVTAEDLIKLRSEQPQATFVCYINTDATVKAECDVCCTSSNALDVIGGLGEEEIMFIPDKNLANWLSRCTQKNIIPWSGFCFVHQRIEPQSISRVRKIHPDASIVVHPGCRPEVIDLADEVLSIERTVEFSRRSSAQKIVIGFEEGLIHRLRRENPQKIFYTAGAAKMCKNNKVIMLEDVYLSLKDEKYRVELPSEVMVKAERSLKRMFELCGEVH